MLAQPGFQLNERLSGLQPKKSLAIIFCAIALHNALFYLVLVYASIFMGKELKFSSGTTLSYVLIASLIAVVILPFGGAFTDAITCRASGCRVRYVANGPAEAHVEGHIAFVGR